MDMFLHEQITAALAFLSVAVPVEGFISFFQLVFALSVGVSIWEGLIPTHFTSLVTAIEQEAKKIEGWDMYRHYPKAQKEIDSANETIEEKGNRFKAKFDNIIRWGQICGTILAVALLILIWTMGVYPESEFMIQRWVPIALTLVLLFGCHYWFRVAKQCLTKWKEELTMYREVHSG